MQLTLLCMISISLSMDAFSLSLIYGLQDMNKKSQYLLSIIVGIFHFLMPMLGNIIGDKIFSIITINLSLITFLILFIIGLEMIISNENNKIIKELTIKNYLFFGLAVSIDAFSLGISLKSIYPSTIISCFMFMVTSMMFTYLGLVLGKKINHIVGKISTKVGGLILMIIALVYLI